MTAQTDTQPRVTEITVGLQNLGDFFDPSETEGMDTERSIERFAQVLRDRLASVYPEATVDVETRWNDTGLQSTVVTVLTTPDYPRGPVPYDPDVEAAQVDLAISIERLVEETKEAVEQIGAQLYGQGETWYVAD